MESYLRHVLCAALCIFTSIACMAIPISVDENVEFISAVCRTAGFREYTNDVNEAYAHRVDSLMTPFAGHDAIKYLDKVRAEQGVSYDAIADLAIHTEIADGHLRLKDGADLSKVDRRWLEGQDRELVPLLDDLYQKSGFTRLYKSNTDYYEHVIDNMNALMDKCDLKWLTDFYGKEPAGSRVVVSLLNVGNYGATQKLAGKPDESVIVIGCNRLDEKGYPIFDGRQSLIVHESSHPVCNPLVERNMKLFNSNIKLAAELMHEELRRGAYAGPFTLMCESMVRSMELQYGLAHGTDETDTDRGMKNQMRRGFMFMPEIREALDVYKSNRERYPVIDSIMPVIADKINKVDVAERYKEIVNSSPKILGCSIAENATGVAPSDSLEVRFFFDQPIRKGSFGMAYYDNNEDIMPKLAEIPQRIRLSDDGMVLSVFIVAEPGKEYGFSMNGAFYRGLKGYSGHGTAKVHFFTKPN